MKTIMFTLFILITVSNLMANEICNIYIHGHSLDTTYFDKYEYNIKWNSNLELADAANEVAKKLLPVIGKCTNRPVVLRTHGYSSNVVYLILGLGKRYTNIYPDNNYVKIFKSVISVYSVSGMFKGTPLMDHICASDEDSEISDVLGKKCVLSMTTSNLYHTSNYVNSPGVPFFLIFGTKTEENNGLIKTSLNSYGLTAEDYFQSEDVHINDGIVPLSSAMGCEEDLVIIDPESECKKINNKFFIDFFRVDYSYFEMLQVREVLENTYNEN